jgi:hypothetical protein
MFVKDLITCKQIATHYVKLKLVKYFYSITKMGIMRYYHTKKTPLFC